MQIVESPAASCVVSTFVRTPNLAAICSFELLITEVIVHLCFHPFINVATQKDFENILDVFSSLNVVLLEQLSYDLSFTIRHANDGYVNFLEMLWQSPDVICHSLLMVKCINRHKPNTRASSFNWSAGS